MTIGFWTIPIYHIKVNPCFYFVTYLLYPNKAGKNEMDDRKIIEECYRLMYEGMVNKDEELLQEVLAPSFVLVHMTGMRQPKAEFIRAVMDGTLNYSSARHQHIDVNIKVCK